LQAEITVLQDKVNSLQEELIALKKMSIQKLKRCSIQIPDEIDNSILLKLLWNLCE